MVAGDPLPSCCGSHTTIAAQFAVMDGNLQDGEHSWGVGVGVQRCNYRSYRSSFGSGANKEQGGEKHTITIPSVAFNSRGAQTSLIFFFFL